MPNVTESIPFVEWQPDLHNHSADLTVAQNVLASGEGYIPVKEFEAINSDKVKASSEITSIGYGVDIQGDSQMFLFGKRIERVSGDYDISDASKGSTDYTANKWEHLEFNGEMIATNGEDNIQKLDLKDRSSNFSDLVAIKAKTIASVKNFLVAGNLYDEDGENGYKMRWSALGNADDWDVSKGATSQAGFQNIASGGEIVRVVGGDIGVIFMQTAIYRMTYVGSPVIFQFDEIETNRGCFIKDSVVKSGNRIYFFDKDGLYMTTGAGQSTPVGYNKINKWFYDLYDDTHPIQALSVPFTDYIYWSFTGKDGKRYILAYNELENKFTSLQFEHTVLGIASQPLKSLDQLTGNLDTDYSVSFDSFQSSGVLLFAINGQEIKVEAINKWYNGRIETGFRDLQSIRSLFNITPFISNKSTLKGNVTGKIYASGDETESIEQTIDAQGNIQQRASGRFMKVNLSTEGDFGKIIGSEVVLNGGSKR